MLADLIKKIDGFVTKYGPGAVGGDRDKDKMKSDLLDLIQEAVDHGEGKSQTNYAGIAVKALKGLFGGKGD